MGISTSIQISSDNYIRASTSSLGPLRSSSRFLFSGDERPTSTQTVSEIGRFSSSQSDFSFSDSALFLTTSARTVISSYTSLSSITVSSTQSEIVGPTTTTALFVASWTGASTQTPFTSDLFTTRQIKLSPSSPSTVSSNTATSNAASLKNINSIATRFNDADLNATGSNFDVSSASNSYIVSPNMQESTTASHTPRDSNTLDINISPFSTANSSIAGSRTTSYSSSGIHRPTMSHESGQPETLNTRTATSSDRFGAAPDTSATGVDFRRLTRFFLTPPGSKPTGTISQHSGYWNSNYSRNSRPDTVGGSNAVPGFNDGLARNSTLLVNMTRMSGADIDADRLAIFAAHLAEQSSSPPVPCSGTIQGLLQKTVTVTSTIVMDVLVTMVGNSTALAPYYVTEVPPCVRPPPANGPVLKPVPDTTTTLLVTKKNPVLLQQNQGQPGAAALFALAEPTQASGGDQQGNTPAQTTPASGANGASNGNTQSQNDNAAPGSSGDKTSGDQSSNEHESGDQSSQDQQNNNAQESAPPSSDGGSGGERFADTFFNHQNSGQDSSGHHVAGDQGSGDQASEPASKSLHFHAQQPDDQQSSDQQSNAQQSSSQESGGQTTNNQQSNPQQSNPQQSNPQQSNPQQSNPQQSNPQQSNPQQSNPQQSNTQSGSGLSFSTHSNQEGSGGDSGNSDVNQNAQDEDSNNGQGAQDAGQEFTSHFFQQQSSGDQSTAGQSSSSPPEASGSESSNQGPEPINVGSNPNTQSNGQASDSGESPQGGNDNQQHDVPTKSTFIDNVPVVLSPDNVIIGSQTFKHGNSPTAAVVNGQTFRWDSANLMVQSTAITFPSPVANGPVVKVGGQDFTVQADDLEAGDATIPRPHDSKPSPFMLDGKIYSLTPSQLIAPDEHIALPQANKPATFVYNGQTLSADSSHLFAGSTSIPISPSGIVDYNGQTLTIKPSEIIGPSTTIKYTPTPEMNAFNAPQAITTGDHVLFVGPSAAVIGSNTYSFLPGQTPKTFEDHGQQITVGPNGINFGSISVPIPTNTPSYSKTTHGSLTISVAPSEAVVGGLDIKNIQSNMVPITTTIDGQTVKIGPQGVAFADTTIPLPTPHPIYSITTDGHLTLSLAPSEAVIQGSTYHLGPGSPTTLKVIDGQTVTIGPSGIDVKGETVKLPSLSLVSPAQATANRVTFSVGATNAVIGGSTYAIGSGARETTVVVGSETIRLGTEGVVLPTESLGMGVVLPATTIPPNLIPTPVIAGGLSFSADASEAIINGTTYAIGSGAPGTTITAGSEIIQLGTGGVILPSTTIKPWLNGGSSGFSSMLSSVPSTGGSPGSPPPRPTNSKGSGADGTSPPVVLVMAAHIIVFILTIILL